MKSSPQGRPPAVTGGSHGPWPAVVAWTLLGLLLALVAFSAVELTTLWQQIAFWLLAACLVILALIFTMRAINAFPDGYWPWVRSHPGSLPFVGWIIVVTPLFIGAFVARDSSTRTTFALSFGACALVMATVAALGWARSQYVVTAELLQVLTSLKGIIQVLTARGDPELREAAARGAPASEKSAAAQPGDDLRDELRDVP